MKKAKSVLGKNYDAILVFDYYCGAGLGLKTNQAITHRARILRGIFREVLICRPADLNESPGIVLDKDIWPEKSDHSMLASRFAAQLVQFNRKKILILVAPPDAKKCVRLVRRHLGNYKAEVSVDMYLKEVYPKKFWK